MTRTKLIIGSSLIVIVLIGFSVYQNSEVTWNVEQVFPNGYIGDQFPDSQINIAILEGVISNHSEFKNNLVWSKDVRNGSDVYLSPNYTLYNDTEHGTFVAGIIASKRDNNGIVGINPYAKIYSIVIGDYDYKDSSNSGPFAPWEARGIYIAVKGPDGILGTNDDADIISMSFGSTRNNSEVFEAIKFAYQQGVVLVGVAGNLGKKDIFGRLTLTKGINSFPGAFPEVIAVGATYENKTLANFSNIASFVEVVAPGHNIKSTIGTNQYNYWSGTSFAVPHVVGVISLLIAKYGKLPIGTFYDLTNTTIRGLLHTMAIDLGEPGYDTSYGHGFVQFY